jgi:hypothetical protein
LRQENSDYSRTDRDKKEKGGSGAPAPPFLFNGSDCYFSMTIDWQLGSFGAGSPPPPPSARQTLAKKRVKSRQPITLNILFITLFLLSFSMDGSFFNARDITRML